MAFKYPAKIFLILFTIPVLFAFLKTSAQTKKHHKKTTDTVPAPTFKFRTIIVDAGRGGKDPGAHGAYSKEKNVTLAIAKKLRAAIIDQVPSLKVVMTRSTDQFVEL